MTKRALTALKESINHWEEMVKNGWENERPYARNCSLCVEFSIGMTHDERCLGCPVQHKTGEKYCFGTPFYTAENAFNSDRLGTFKHHAKREVEFLKSLLPNEEETKCRS